MSFLHPQPRGREEGFIPLQAPQPGLGNPWLPRGLGSLHGEVLFSLWFRLSVPRLVLFPTLGMSTLPVWSTPDPRGFRGT